MKKVFMLAMVAFMTLAVSQKAQAIEDPNPKGTLVIGVRGGVYCRYLFQKISQAGNGCRQISSEKGS